MDNPFLKLLVGLFLGTYYWIVAIFQFFVPPPKKDVSGKVVLVTGAGSGLGQMMSLQFAKLGCKVVGWDVSAKGLQETEELMAQQNLKTKWRAYKCDLSDRHQVYDIADKVKSDIGDVDILINNAGIVTGKPFLNCRDEMMIKTMEVNAMAHFWTLKAFLPAMMEKNSGHVVTIASGAGLFGVAGQVDYAASKFAAVGLTEALHMELHHQNKTGVITTTVCPYYIDTGMFKGVSTAMMPMITAEDAVSQIVDAVLRNKVLLMMPRSTYFMYYLKGLQPVRSSIEMARAFSVMSSMDSFQGRHED